mmetsp:Transcript_25123/g.94965  ORF Transcript_25123/g.94965 Transcript_25123/m.94965 type:complete len:207 (+) Transcript_25123:820-1440(+)
MAGGAGNSAEGRASRSRRRGGGGSAASLRRRRPSLAPERARRGVCAAPSTLRLGARRGRRRAGGTRGHGPGCSRAGGALPRAHCHCHAHDARHDGVGLCRQRERRGGGAGRRLCRRRLHAEVLFPPARAARLGGPAGRLAGREPVVIGVRVAPRGGAACGGRRHRLRARLARGVLRARAGRRLGSAGGRGRGTSVQGAVQGLAVGD